MPVFLRLQRDRLITNPPFAWLRFEIEVQREVGAQRIPVFSRCWEQGSVGSSGRCLKDPSAGGRSILDEIPIGSFPAGTRLRVVTALDGVTESGGCCGTLTDPKVAEADVGISLCSAVAGAFLVGASGAKGTCAPEGDFRLVSIEPIQSVRDAPKMVAGKDAVIRVDIESSFGEETSDDITFTIRRSPLPDESFRETVAIPAGCTGPVRYYFPQPERSPGGSCLAWQSRGGLRGIPSANSHPGSPAIGQEPQPFSTYEVEAEIVPTDPAVVDADDSNNKLRSPTYRVAETFLTSIYTQVNCAPQTPCDLDPLRYGAVDEATFELAVDESNVHTLAMLPVSPEGFRGRRCLDGEGAACFVSGGNQKCVTGGGVAGCAGIMGDLKRAWIQARNTSSDATRAVVMFPNSYLVYHRYPVSPSSCGELPLDDCRAAVSGIFLPGVAGAEKAVAVRAIEVALLGRAATPHELVHSFGLTHSRQPPPPYLPLQDPAPAPFGYWVKCHEHVSDPEFADCESPQAGGQNFMKNPNAVGPPLAWIDVGVYDHVLEKTAIGVDPAVLNIVGTISKNGAVVVEEVWEDTGLIDRPAPGEYAIEFLDDRSNVLSSTPFSVSFDLEIEGPAAVDIVQTDSVPLMLALEYPSAAARIRIRRGNQTLTELDVASHSLRALVMAIPDRAFERNASERRRALLEKVDAFESIMKKPNFRPACEKLIKDIRDKLEKWVIEYKGQPDELSKAIVLARLDRIAERIALRSPK